jgi:branched-chain amino acid transport system substrate-binding protein
MSTDQSTSFSSDRRSECSKQSIARLLLLGGLLACAVLDATQVFASDAPTEIKIGTLYASSGRFASISMPVYKGLKLWAEQKNVEGGVYVKAFDKKLPIHLVSYDDQSNTATASTLYSQLVTQDKVDLLVSDSGSILTAPAVTIAQDHKMFLFDQNGSAASFFSKDNPYIGLVGAPVSTALSRRVADFIIQDGAALGIKRVALLYATNEFTGTHAKVFREMIQASGVPIEIVYDQGVPTETNNYTIAINNIRSAKPDAVIELGYVPNDIAFLRNVQDVGAKFNMIFCLWPGLEGPILQKNVGPKGLEHVFTYVSPTEANYPVNFGMALEQYKAAWDQAYPESKVEFGENAASGYTAGLVIEKTLSEANSLEQLELRRAALSLSGKLNTLYGKYEINEMGAQTGELAPLGQVELDANGAVKFVWIHPHEVATGKPIYPRP